MANNVPQPPASSAAKKRVYALLATNVLIGISLGLLLAPMVPERGLVSFALLMLALLIMAFAVSRWPDPL